MAKILSFPPPDLTAENPWSPCRAALQANAKDVFCMLYICFIICGISFFFSSSGLETIFLAFVADKNELFFGRLHGQGRFSLLLPSPWGAKAEILEEELN